MFSRIPRVGVTVVKIAAPQCREFCAWRPEWQRKKPRPAKLAAARERLKKSPIKAMQVSAAKQVKLLQKQEKRMRELVTEQPEPADNVFDPGNEHFLAEMKAFHNTSSPFVYLACPEEEIYEPDRYWTRQALFHRNKSTFFFIPPSDFGHELPSGTSIGEVAFLGRSNVGKSSLMNSLMQEKLARTSKAPGRTQNVGYYGMFMPPDHIRYKEWRLATGFFVDLPGYGYARGPDDAVDAWQKHTQTYLLDRMELGCLKRLYVLVDSRHPKQDLDWNIFTWLDTVGYKIPYTIVLTKADAVRDPSTLVPHLNVLGMRYQHKSQERIEKNIETFGGQSPVIHITSATDNMGLSDLWKSITWELGLKVRPDEENSPQASVDKGFLEDYDEFDEEDYVKR